tara:strand:- start:14 stop:220 length:207 start_codon:yes stop_codon:yes gene_type:complete
MLYPADNFNQNYNQRIRWVTQKNIEAEENKGQKKEELKEKIKRSKFQWNKSIRLNPLVYGSLLYRLLR